LDVQIGRAKAFRDFGIFLGIFIALLALKRLGMPDFFGLAWWALVLVASRHLLWKVFRNRNDPDRLQGPGGWGAVTRPKT
jgi:hypothetical protein